MTKTIRNVKCSDCVTELQGKGIEALVDFTSGLVRACFVDGVWTQFFCELDCYKLDAERVSSMVLEPRESDETKAAA